MTMNEFAMLNKNVTEVENISDGYHTFKSLYEQRKILSAALVKAYPEASGKSHLHHDGEVPFGGGWFIVWWKTPKGMYSYHYEDKDWDLFDCKEYSRAPEYDGHTDKDVSRLLSLTESENFDWR